MTPAPETPAKLRRSQIPHIATVGIRDVGSGIYFLLGAGDELLYVGQSLHVAHRCTDHAIAGTLFVRATWQPVPAPLLNEFEQEYIFEFAPSLNKANQARGMRVNRRLNRPKSPRQRPGYDPTRNSWGYSGARFRHKDTNA